MNYLVHWRTLLLTASLAATSMFSGCLSIRYIPAGGSCSSCTGGLLGPTCGADVVAPGCGVDVVAPGCGVDVVAPGCGVDVVAPGCGVDVVAPGCGCNQGGHGDVYEGYIEDYADGQQQTPPQPVFARKGARFHPLPTEPVFSNRDVVQATAMAPASVLEGPIVEQPAGEPGLLPAGDAAPAMVPKPMDNGPFQAEPQDAPVEEIPTPAEVPGGETSPPADGATGVIDGPEAEPAPAAQPPVTLKSGTSDADDSTWTKIPGAPPKQAPAQTRAANKWRVRLR